MRALDGTDRLIIDFDRGLRALAGVQGGSGRPYPAEAVPEAELTEGERHSAAGLMRVDHAGEVAAQALYHSQALTARSPAVRAHLREAAREEGDHLDWCARRLRELDSHASRLVPAWYAGSFAIGALAGFAGDRVSLGFVEETERQVEAHLDGHLERLPAADARSRALIEQMRRDEIRHGAEAHAAGAMSLPAPVRGLMRAVARVMTATAYWL